MSQTIMILNAAIYMKQHKSPNLKINLDPTNAKANASRILKILSSYNGGTRICLFRCMCKRLNNGLQVSTEDLTHQSCAPAPHKWIGSTPP
jgi:hypothetical protein